ncbi:MAG: PD-(D/E)XK nuclease family protein [Candidatus Izemoplasmatales bacterium]|nr:PD-(D/E)XK nuclease family protein [Candidatus Izemoplasmatales bacterium]
MNGYEKARLEDFLLDIDILDKLSNWINEVNFFEVTKTSHKELTHSNVLAWLFNSNENHNLKDSIVRTFIQKVIKSNVNEKNIDVDNFNIFFLDFDSFTIKREWQNIDIFMVSETNKFTITIENKIYAVERDNQTIDYRSKVERIYPKDEYKNLYIYLTYQGNEAMDKEHWLKADYQMIVESLEKVVTKHSSMSSTVKLILENYISTVRRKILMDNELVKICEEIYKKHKTALDLIYEYRPDNISNISEYITDYIEMHALKYNLVFDRKYSTKSYIRFTTKFIDSIVPRLDNNKFGWGNGKGLMYEIELLSNTYCRCFLTISNLDDQKCIKLYELSQANRKRFNVFNRSVAPRQWARIFRSNIILDKKQIDDGLEEVKELLDRKLVHLFEKEIPNLEIFLNAELNK